MTADILLTAGILSLIHYAEAKHCMTVKGYVKEIPKEDKPKEEPKKEASTGFESSGSKIDPSKPNPQHQLNLPPWQR